LESLDDASEQAAATFESAKSNIKEIAEGAVRYGQRALTEQTGNWQKSFSNKVRAQKAASQNLRQESWRVGATGRRDASHLDRASNYLREKELSEIYYDAEDFTRRRPGLVFGMMFAAGLLAARFVKASNRGPENGYLSNVESAQNSPKQQASPSSASRDLTHPFGSVNSSLVFLRRPDRIVEPLGTIRVRTPEEINHRQLQRLAP
jgi:hypothetical protein